MKHTYPPNLGELYAKAGSVKALAEQLGMPRTTVSSELSRQNLLSAQTPATAPGSFSLEAAEIPVIRRKYDTDKHYVYPLGDVHLGAKEHKGEAWQEWLDYLTAHKDTSMVGVGDFLNTAIKDSVSDVYDETLSVPKAQRLLRQQLDPLAKEDRIDVLIPGNHEDRVTKSTGICPIEDVADFLGVPYAAAAVLLVYEIGEIEYRVFLRHGTGNGQSVAAAEKSAQVILADVYITGHTHAQFVKTDEFFDLSADGLSTVRHRRYYLSAGSFMGLEKYAAQRGYKATRIGAPRLLLMGDRKDVHASL